MFSKQNKWITIPLLLFLLLVFWLGNSYSQRSVKYHIKTSKISSGATPVQSAQYFNLHSTVGQVFSSRTVKDSIYNLTSGFLGIINVKVTEVEQPTDVANPVKYRLYQNYPNPFNPETTIQFDVSSPTKVVLKVYDLLGREVIILVDALHQPGVYKITFDASNLASGMYFYQIQMNDFVAVKKMVLLE